MQDLHLEAEFSLVKLHCLDKENKTNQDTLLLFYWNQVISTLINLSQDTAD